MRYSRRRRATFQFGIYSSLALFCIVSPAGAVLDGKPLGLEPVTKGMHRHLVTLTNSGGEPFCQGVFVRPTVVFTAAHCIDGRWGKGNRASAADSWFEGICGESTEGVTLPARPEQINSPPKSSATSDHQSTLHADDIAFWQANKDSKDAKIFESYLEKFPNGLYRESARYMAKRLRANQ